MTRKLRRVSLPIRPCSPVCVWRARTDLASFHVTRWCAGKTLGFSCSRQNPGGLSISLLRFSALPDWAGLGSVTCIRCIRVTLECDGLICHASITRKYVRNECVCKNVREIALCHCPRYVAASLRVVHSVGISPQHGIGRSCRPLPCPRPLGAPFPGGKAGALGSPQAVRAILTAMAMGGMGLPRCAWCPRATLTAKSVLSVPRGDRVRASRVVLTVPCGRSA